MEFRESILPVKNSVSHGHQIPSLFPFYSTRIKTSLNERLQRKDFFTKFINHNSHCISEKNNCPSEEESRKPRELFPSACRFLSIGDKYWDSHTSAQWRAAYAT